jgi:hypothetical protein
MVQVQWGWIPVQPALIGPFNSTPYTLQRQIATVWYHLNYRQGETVKPLAESMGLSPGPFLRSSRRGRANESG